MWFIGKCDITTCSAGKILKHTHSRAHTHTHTVGTPTQTCGGETSDDNKVMWAASTMIQWSIVTHSLSLSLDSTAARPLLHILALSLSLLLQLALSLSDHRYIYQGSLPAAQRYRANACFLNCTDLPSLYPSSF